MYKSKQFEIRPLECVLSEIEKVRQSKQNVRRVFIADGDALALPVDYLVAVLSTLKKSFPHLARISAYASAVNLNGKTALELKQIRENGLELLYLGLESGDDEVLSFMRKGASAKDHLQASEKAQAAGFVLSVIIILGLGGVEGSLQHALKTAAVVSGMQAPYLSVLTLMLPPDAPLSELVARNDFHVPDSMMILKELYALIQALDVKKMVFRTNHASNYLNLRGSLPMDQERLLEEIKQAIQHQSLRPEWSRFL
jgi:radical SAM superfamily enzyme YgiQ (UPF0313 family)